MMSTHADSAEPHTRLLLHQSTIMTNALDLIDAAIADLEAKLHLSPGENLEMNKSTAKQQTTKKKKKKQPNKPSPQQQRSDNNKAPQQNTNLPDICKLEFKVGVITRVWVHPDADKLYCEEIDVGEEESPRQIASGLRPHFTEEQMLGQRLLVVSNLKAKNLVGFKSHGMVLCAAGPLENGEERVEFVEPPEGVPVGEIITFDGLPPPEPWSGAQVEKKKIFQACMPKMKTTKDCVATWDGHEFMTTLGPCKTRTIAGGVLR
jgi:aminoacyl tRNA synthase complex-interacting multifunctional protein 1